MKKELLYMLGLGVVLLGACDTIDQQKEKDMAVSSVGSSTDNAKKSEKFVKDAYRNNLKLIEIGKLGQKNASGAEVKAFADKLVEHHTRMNEELLEIAGDLSIEQPKGSERKIPDIGALEKEKAGNKFDKHFLKMAAKRHKKDLNLYENAGEELEQEQLRNYAISNIPAIQEHLDQAESLEASVKSDSDDANM